jgi:hypothetical protein
MTPSDQKPSSIVIFSTRDSVENGIFSIVAFIETLLSVVFFLWVDKEIPEIRYIFLSPLAVGVFLLMRCKQSEELGLAQFLEYETAYFRNWSNTESYTASRVSHPMFWVGCVLAATASVAAAYLMPTPAFITHEIILLLWGLFLGALAAWVGLVAVNVFYEVRGFQALSRLETTIAMFPTFILSMCVLYETRPDIVVSGATVGFIIFVILSLQMGYISQRLSGAPVLGLGPSIFPRSTWIRIKTTIRFAHIGFFEIPNNYRRLIWAMAINHPPEIVPGYDKYGGVFKFKNFWNHFKSAKIVSLDKLLFLWAIGVWFLPAYFYRITLRSTFVIYLPLLYLGKEIKEAQEEPTFLMRYNIESRYSRVFLVFSIVSLVFFAFGTLTPENLQVAFTLPVQSWFLLFDLKSVWWPQWIGAAGALLTIEVSRRIERVKFRYEEAKAVHRPDLIWKCERMLEFALRLMLLRNVLTAIWFLIAVGLGVFVIYPEVKCRLESIFLWVPSFKEILFSIYGGQIPKFGTACIATPIQ